MQRFARATTPEELLARWRSGKLDRFTPYVHQLCNAGCTEASVLHAELVKLGWRGASAPCSATRSDSATPTGHPAQHQRHPRR